jgi:hypothetical protein
VPANHLTKNVEPNVVANSLVTDKQRQLATASNCVSKKLVYSKDKQSVKRGSRAKILSKIFQIY